MMDDVRTEKKRKDLNRGCKMGGSRRLLFLRAGIMVLVVTVTSVVSVGITLADEQALPSMTIGLQQGAITAIHEKTLDIDGRTYGLTPDVVMLDEQGEALEPGRLMVTAEVKFHVKKEQSNKIDKLIVTLPR
ncbi:MAG: hypothetical protein Q7U76_14040 [Nitrospirota bacterium]|nr:hypothetical protein [Nitrospirota bacterium]